MSSTSQLPKPILINQQEALLNLVNTIIKHPLIAIDTESNSLFAYQEQVCLIQFSIPGVDYLVDCLAISDLTPLAKIFDDPKIEKIFHAAEYDIICLNRDFEYTFKNIFDTMVASRILGKDKYGLGSILQNEFNINLDKRHQRANWGQRPLPDYLLEYARLDTHFLIPLRNRLRDELVEKKLLPLAQEDFARTCLVNEKNNNHNKKTQDCWKINGSNLLTPQQAAVLNELCRYRETQAKYLNRPLFKVIGDRTLIKIAETCPKNQKELSDIPGMTKGQIRRHGENIIRLVKIGLKSKPIYPQYPPRPDENFMIRLEKLRRWRIAMANNMGVQSDVIMPRDLLQVLAKIDQVDRNEINHILKDVPWRLNHFGLQIQEILSKL